ILNLKPGTRVVSNSWSMQDWEDDETATVPGCALYCTVHFWVVPAKVAGTWRLPAGTLELRQQYQGVQGTLTTASTTTPTSNGRLRGDQISFAVGSDQYLGRVNGDVIDGTVHSQESTTAWRATRIRR